jgi:hypothetical protein
MIQLTAIKELKNTLESKEEAKKKQVLNIMKESKLVFLYEDGNEGSWQIKVSYLKAKQAAV